MNPRFLLRLLFPIIMVTIFSSIFQLPKVNINGKLESSNLAIPFAPPRIIFGIAWPILLILLGLSYAYGIKDNNNLDNCGNIETLYIAIIYNLLIWLVYFHYTKTRCSLFIIIFAIILCIGTLYYSIKNNSMISLFSILPLIVWLTFAAFMNGYLVINNVKLTPTFKNI